MLFKKGLVSLSVLVVVVTMGGCKKHEHTFSNATCEKPKICEECGYESGGSLGHTTTLGYCSRCDKYQGEEIVDDFMWYATNSVQNWIKGLEYITEYSNTNKSKAMSYAKPYFNTAKKEFEKLYELCSNEPKLKIACSTLSLVIYSIPTSNNVNVFYDELSDALDILEKWFTESTEIIKKIAPN